MRKIRKIFLKIRYFRYLNKILDASIKLSTVAIKVEQDKTLNLSLDERAEILKRTISANKEIDEIYSKIEKIYDKNNLNIKLK